MTGTIKARLQRLEQFDAERTGGGLYVIMRSPNPTRCRSPTRWVACMWFMAGRMRLTHLWRREGPLASYLPRPTI
jgi:hypothetical protein